MRNDSKIFRIFVKNSKKNALLEFDPSKNAYIVHICERPEKGKANTEIVKFLSKKLKKQVRIKSGLKSKLKTIEVIS